MTFKETSKRYILFIIGLFFSALGVAFTKHGGLGVSPISSVPNIMSIGTVSIPSRKNHFAFSLSYIIKKSALLYKGRTFYTILLSVSSENSRIRFRIYNITPLKVASFKTVNKHFGSRNICCNRYIVYIAELKNR